MSRFTEKLCQPSDLSPQVSHKLALIKTQPCTLYVAESVTMSCGASPLSGSVTSSMLSAPIVSDATTTSYSETVPTLVIWSAYTMVSPGSASPSSLTSVHVPDGTEIPGQRGYDGQLGGLGPHRSFSDHPQLRPVHSAEIDGQTSVWFTATCTWWFGPVGR